MVNGEGMKDEKADLELWLSRTFSSTRDGIRLSFSFSFSSVSFKHVQKIRKPILELNYSRSDTDFFLFLSKNVHKFLPPSVCV